MVYYDPVIKKKLEKALEDLGIDCANYPELIRIYFLIRLVKNFIPKSSEDDLGVFEEVLKSDHFLIELMLVDAQQLASSRPERVRNLFRLMTENALDDPTSFFRLLAPALVADWAGLLSMFKGDNWEKLLLILYYICVRIHQASGTNAVFSYNPSVVAEDLIDNGVFADYSMDFIEKCVRYALYIELPSVNRKRKISTKKMRRLINNISTICSERGNITARECILQHLATGDLMEDEKLNNYLSAFEKVGASDIIPELQPQKQQEDLPLLRFVLMRFTEISNGEMLIYNPAPHMMTEFENLGGVQEQTCFVVPDMMESRALKKEFPAYKIYGECEVLENPQRNILVFETDWSSPSECLGNVLTQCAAGNPRVLIYAPQVDMGKIKKVLKEFGYHINAMLGLPIGISTTTPAKKTIIYASVTCHDVVRLMMAERNVQQGKGKTGQAFLPVNAMYISRKMAEVPQDWLDQNLTILQMISMKETAKVTHDGKYRKALEFAWSREITIFYLIYTRENDNWQGRAYVKSVLFQNGKLKYGEKIGAFYEKGLRGKSVDEILQKLPQILYKPEIYEAYIPVLEDLYNDSPRGLSLKTIWYMTRTDLQRLTTYNEAVCFELFCGECQKLADVYPMTASADEIMDALEAVCGTRNVPEPYLKQVSLIFKNAIDRKFFGENKLASVITRVRTQRTEMENVLSRLRKRTLTDQEIRRILKKLTEKVGKFPRYASDSYAFFMIMTLFMPVQLVHLRALTWGDVFLNSNLCSVQISKKITRDGQVITVDPPYRVACSPIVTRICEQRLGFLELTFGVTQEMLKNEYIFWENNLGSMPDLQQKMESISHATAKKLQRQMMEFAGVQPVFVQVTDEDKTQTIDLNEPYMRNFWHNNVVTKGALKGLERGEVSYLLGKTPQDTLDAHYFGFGAVYNQLRMATIQNRWTCAYAGLIQPTIDVPRQRTLSVHSDVHVESDRDLGKCNCLFFEIYPEKYGGEMQFAIDSQFGHHGEIVRVEDDYQGDIRLTYSERR